MSLAAEAQSRRRRLARRIPWRAVGPAVSTKRRVQATLFILLVLLAGVLATGVLAAYDLYRSAENRYIDVVFPLRNATKDVVLRMVDEETGVRGYMITTDRRSLAPYFLGKSGLQKDLAQIRRLSRSHPDLTARLRVLEQEIVALQGYYDRLITFVADGRLGQRVARSQTLNGQKLFARFRRTSTLMQRDIDVFVQQTRATQHRTFQGTVGILGVTGFFALAIAATLFVNVPERLRKVYAAEQQARLRAEQGANAARALEHVSDAVLLIDESGRIRFWNSAAEQLFGMSESLAVGRLAQKVVAEYARLVEGGRKADSFVPVWIGDSERWLAPALSTFEGGSVLTIRDVTVGHMLERARGDFVTTASHELRTPLTAIYGGVQTLLEREDELSREQRERLMRVIEQESAHLSEVVDQLLVTAQLDRDSLRLHESTCDVRRLAASVLDAAAARKPKGITLALDAPEDLAPISCDAGLLRQVLVNLVENAVKYSPQGGHIDVVLREEVSRIRIDVRDEGLGIPPEEQERIFEKFYRLDAQMSRGVGGSGLGLYISREIVTRMGGTLSLQSAPGTGSTFTVTLPRHPA